MKLIEKLSLIQQEIKVPKNLYNSFGKYNYRNCESILEAFKPFEEKYRVCLIVTDDVIDVGGKNYIEAIATLYDLDSSDTLFGKASAREIIDKKGMDDSQITGTASSYARKYALNGLFLLDDTKDADTDEYKRQTAPKQNTSKPPQEPKASDEQIQIIRDLCNKWKVDALSLYTSNNVTESTITATKAREFIDGLKKKFEGK